MSLKQKNIALLIGFLVVLVVCFNIPIKQTLNMKKEFTELTNEDLLFADIPNKINSLNAEKVYLDSVLLKYQFSSNKSFQSNLLQSITTYADKHKLSVINFEEPHKYINQDKTLNTYLFTVRGSYTNTLKLIHDLEQTKKLGTILSANTEKKRNYRTNKQFIETVVLLQRLSD